MGKKSPQLFEEKENLEKREKLGWKSSFEIYCRRKGDELLSEGQNFDGAIDISEYIRPSAKDDKYHHKYNKSRGEKQKGAEDKISRKMLDSHARKNIYKLYKCGDKVFIRVGTKKGRWI